MRVAVIGANGQLGCDVSRAFSDCGWEVTRLCHDDVEIADIDSGRNRIAAVQPDFVVNTAAMHNLDVCEAEAMRAFEVNALGARNLAILSNELSFVLAHISTDYVFDGKKGTPYLECDCAVPLNVYGNSKLAGEQFVRTIAGRHFVIRVSGLYGMNPCRAKGGSNFVNLMLRLAGERDEVRVVDDEVLTPTFTEDVARQLLALCDVEEYGLYHATAQGGCSWHAFAAKVFELAKSDVKLSVADPSEFPMKVPRPKYSVLENEGLKALGLDLMAPWEDGLRRYLKRTGALRE
jgi:dTDP-4-dehydrorhamnose reductase